MSPREVGQAYSNATEDESLRELGLFLVLTLIFVISCGGLIVIITITIHVVRALLNPKLQVEECLQVPQEGHALLRHSPKLHLGDAIPARDGS